MKLLKRELQDSIESRMFKGRAIVVYGARQVGKTTLLKMIANHYKDVLFLNCDEPDIITGLSQKTSTALKEYIGNHRLVILDEAQRIENIGLIIKLLVDNFPEIQVIASGSSSFDLSDKIKEPLTGRKFEFYLYPFSLREISQLYDRVDLFRIIEARMIYGMYPSLIDTNDGQYLKQITSDYLYKDVLSYSRIRSHEAVIRLLQALALQIGGEVSYTELSGLTGIDKKTVEAYINVLEKSFVIFRLMPFSRNLRNELKKTRKIYFYDLGIRNAIINNFNPLSLRADAGQIFENFVISERIKYNNNMGNVPNIYFWRTKQQQEIDYIEEASGKLSAYEIKYQFKKIKMPRLWKDAYPDASFEVITMDNFLDFIF